MRSARDHDPSMASIQEQLGSVASLPQRDKVCSGALCSAEITLSGR